MLKPCSVALISSLFIASAAGAQAAPAPAEPAPVAPSTPASDVVPTTAPASEAAVSAPAAAPAEPPPPPPSAAAPAPAAETAAKPPAANADLPPKLAVGSEGYFKPGINLQGWFELNDRYDSTYGVRLRRAEISAKGDILPGLVGYQLMIDPAKVLEPQNKVLPVTNMGMNVGSVTASQPASALSILQDFFITLQSEYLDASLGQFKIPVSYEGYMSSSKIVFPERHSVSRYFGDRRDLGIRLAKTFKYLGYSAGIFNGAGPNTLDTNHAKDGALRLEVYPIEGLTIAGVGYATLWDRTQNGAKDRIEFDLRFEKAGFLFLGEIIAGNDVGAMNAKVKSFGMYGILAYKLPFNLEAAFRIGYLDQNTKIDLKPMDKNSTTDELTQWDVGLNYYLKGNEVKFQLNYSQFAYQTLKNNHQFIVAAQVSY